MMGLHDGCPARQPPPAARYSRQTRPGRRLQPGDSRLPLPARPASPAAAKAAVTPAAAGPQGKGTDPWQSPLFLTSFFPITNPITNILHCSKKSPQKPSPLPTPAAAKGIRDTGSAGNRNTRHKNTSTSTDTRKRHRPVISACGASYGIMKNRGQHSPCRIPPANYERI